MRGNVFLVLLFESLIFIVFTLKIFPFTNRIQSLEKYFFNILDMGWAIVLDEGSYWNCSKIITSPDFFTIYDDNRKIIFKKQMYLIAKKSYVLQKK